MIESRMQDIVVVDKVNKETMIIDVVLPRNTRVCDKECEKIEKYSLLEDKIARLRQMKRKRSLQFPL